MFLKSYGYWVGLLASVVGLLAPLMVFLKLEKYDVLFAMMIVLVAVIFIVGENLYLKKHWRRKKRYPEIFKILNGAFSPLNQLARIDPSDKKAINNLFIESCTKISEAFTKITNTHCGVSIKVIQGNFRTEGNKAGIETFVRDNDSMLTRNKTVYQSEMNIDENTDFKEICDNLRNGQVQVRHFFSNDLLINTLKGYRNSRFGHEVYEYVRKNNGGLKSNDKSYRLLSKIWGLQYRSTIVVAIYPLIADREYELVGFLCLDSPDVNVFLEYDQDIMYGIADTIFSYRDFIKLYYK